MAKITRRVPADSSDGHVLPIAWNMPEQEKMKPLATKFHAMMRRNSVPTATTAGPSVNGAISTCGAHAHSSVITRHHRRLDQRRGDEGLAHAIRAARAEVLPGHRRHGERDRHRRQEDRLHDARADAEARLRLGAEAADAASR